MTTPALPDWLYRSEAFAEDLDDLVAPAQATSPFAGRRPVALMLLPAIVALASGAATALARSA